MKLYEFSYADQLKLSREELLERVMAFLKDEQIEQGWAADFQVKESAPAKISADGTTEYFFEVLGSFVASDDFEAQMEIDVLEPGSDPFAAKEVSL